MRKILLVLILAIFFYKTNSKPIIVKNVYVDKYITDTVCLVDTVKVQSFNFNPITAKTIKRINTEDELILFIKYIKTQQSVWGDDCKAVIHTMINRLNYYGITWYEYYRLRKYNNSNSIAKMISGRINPIVDLKNTNDSLIYDYTVKVLKGKGDYFPEDILYFESFKVCPNRGPHLLKNLRFKFVHKYYAEPRFYN